MKKGEKNIAGKGRMRERMDQILMHPSQEHLQVLSGGVSPKDAGRCHTGSSAFAHYFSTTLRGSPGWLHPWGCCPVVQGVPSAISEVGIFLQIHLTRRLIQCERAHKGATGEGKVDHEDSITDHISVENISVLHCWCLINIIFQECRFCSG